MFRDPSPAVRSAINRDRIWTGSGTAPPRWPLWTGRSRQRTSTSTWHIPRSRYVSPGTPVSKFEVSESTTASAAIRLLYLSRNAARFSDPISSSPSIRNFTLHGSDPAVRR